MGDDAAVTAQRDGDAERDQLAGLGVEMPGFLADAAQADIAPDRLGAELRDLADRAFELLLIGGPVHHHDPVSLRWRRAERQRGRPASAISLRGGPCFA
jgi:hypothetical protein